MGELERICAVGVDFGGVWFCCRKVRGKSVRRLFIGLGANDFLLLDHDQVIAQIIGMSRRRQ